MRRFLLIAGILLVALQASAAVSRDGSCSATGTSCTISAVSTGDLIVVFAFRNGSVTAPSLPASNTSIATSATAAGGTVASLRIYCRKASSGADTGTGTATNATSVMGIAYKGNTVNATADCNRTGVAPVSSGNTSNAKTSTAASYPGITLLEADGQSWVAGFMGGTASSTCTPTGMTSVSGTGTILGNDSNAVIASWSTTTCTVSSETWMTYVVEILDKATVSHVVQTCPLNENGAGTTVTCTFGSNATAGNLIVAMAEDINTPTTMNLTDSQSVTVTYPSTFQNLSVAGTRVSVGYFIVGSTAALTVTGTSSSSGTDKAVMALEITGYSTIDTSSKTAGGSNAITPTSGRSEVIAAFAATDISTLNPVVSISPFTLEDSGTPGLHDPADATDTAASTTGSYTAVFTGGTTAEVFSMSFYTPSAGTCLPSLALIGVGKCG